MTRLLSIFLLLSTFWSFQIGVAYKHAHYFSNGLVIEHAHPFRSPVPLSSDSSHHSFFDFAFVGGGFVDVQASLSHWAISLIATDFQFQPFILAPARLLLVDNKQSRAPPVFLS